MKSRTFVAYYVSYVRREVRTNGDVKPLSSTFMDNVNLKLAQSSQVMTANSDIK